MIDVFYSGECDSSQHGEGRHALLTVNVTVPAPVGGGDMGVGGFGPTFTLHPPRSLATGDWITGDSHGANGNTSEFSKCLAYYDEEIFADGFK